MDPLSQGVVGAVAPQAVSRSHVLIAGLLGFLAGMTPDLDVLIRSESDPILFLEYHRQFTHSLIFIPIGGLLCGVILHYLFARWHLRFWQTVAYCTLGYATHGLLDACTSYGTQLFWPFSTARVAWHNISIIDPLFTLPLAVLVVTAAVSGRSRWSRLALVWAAVYLGFGVVQRERVEAAGQSLAVLRGHAPVSVEGKPSFGNLVLWKTIYEFDGYYYVDAIRAATRIDPFPGERVAKLDLSRDFAWLDPNSQQARDVERFRWFSGGFLAKSSTENDMIVDMRYSALPNRADGLWGIVLSPDASRSAHVGYRTMRDTGADSFRALLAMVTNDATARDDTEPSMPCAGGDTPRRDPCR